jgi:para-aminobenzoate synthetase/4-amino-4-deoxychorismate lyase
VIDGRPVELEAHLARLDDSVRSVFGAPPPERSRELVVERARGIAVGRLRLTIAATGEDRSEDGDGTEVDAEVVTADVDPALVFPSWERAVTLRGVGVDGGLGAHKWVDRRIVQHAESDPDGPLALIRDGDAVLEASRANVFAARDGALTTPPADGRILPGVARARAIEVARAAGIEVREQPLTLEELGRADEVLLTGSVRGVEPVRAVEGLRSWTTMGDVTRSIADGLRALWISGSAASIRR